MRTRRARLIAAQTLVTVILMAVVAATWLSPDSANQLFGVDVPGASPPVAQGPPTYEPGAEGAGEDRGGSNGSGAGGSGAAGAASVPPAGGAEATTPFTRPPGGAVGPEAPTDDQYANTLAQLSESVD